jgi:hypothetical protein
VPALRSNSTNPQPALKAVGAGFGLEGADGRVFPPEIVSALPGCCKRAGVEVTRSEAAHAFSAATKTLARWELKYDLPVKRKNARVIRYTEATFLALLAAGKKCNRVKCEDLGFNHPELLKLAAVLHPNFGDVATPQPDPADSVFVAGSDEDRKVIAMLRHPVHGNYLRKMAEAIAG